MNDHLENKQIRQDQTMPDQDAVCAMVHDLLPLYVEGLVSPKSAECIEQHAANCPKCAASLKALQEPEPEIRNRNAEEIPIQNALNKTGRTIRKSRWIASVMVVLCIVFAIVTGWLLVQDSRLSAQDIVMSGQYRSADGESSVLVLTSTDPSVGFMKSQIACNGDNSTCDLTVYGGSGLRNQKESLEVVIPKSANEVRVNGELVYQDGELIKPMCRYYAPYINGYPGSTQQMQLSRPNFAIDHTPVTFIIDATEDPDARIWVWKTEDCTLREVNESQIREWRDRCLITLALTPALEEIRVEDKDGNTLCVSKSELADILSKEEMKDGFSNEAELQRFLNRTLPAAG